MTDRELLELAAKAAGIDIGWYVMINGARCPIIAPKTQHEKNWLGHEYTEWNPLEDDGDALRLAVKLGMDTDVCLDTESTWAMSGESDQAGCTENHADDPYAATRRAIVRVAASLASSL